MILLVTQGDPHGIGPEIFQKTIRTLKVPKSTVIIGVGASAPWKKSGIKLISPFGVLKKDLKRQPLLGPKTIYWIDAPIVRSTRSLAGFQSGWSIARSVELILQKKADALVTGPISKVHLREGGFRYPGHTEMLASLTRSSEPPTMMLANPKLRVSLVTTHLPLKSVPRAITAGSIERAVRHTLLQFGNRARVKIAVLGLNPHAGERGHMGSEETKVICPTIRKLQKRLGSRVILEGPLPADTAFLKHDQFDAFIAMYHDQGLTAVKLLDFPHTVNVTLGLPLIRTSVDHGTAFDIAGKGIADPRSFQSALKMAAELAAAQEVKNGSKNHSIYF